MELTLTDMMLLAGVALAVLAAIAKLTPTKLDDKFVAALMKALETLKANKPAQDLLERARKSRKKDG